MQSSSSDRRILVINVGLFYLKKREGSESFEILYGLWNQVVLSIGELDPIFAQSL